jgi:hypothetical protein
MPVRRHLQTPFFENKKMPDAMVDCGESEDSSGIGPQ